MNTVTRDSHGRRVRAIWSTSFQSSTWNARLFLPALVIASMFALLLIPTAQAQDDGTSCPALPPTAQLSWEVIQPQGLVFCRALRNDGTQAFAVTLSAESPFRPSRGLREERVKINGEDTWWYRSELGGSSSQIVRETLVELPGKRVAHVSILANSPEQLAQSQQWVSELRF